jgi:hypothetical protein
MRKCAVIQTAQMECDVQLSEGGLLQGQRCGTGEMSLGEVEEREDSESLGRATVAIGTGDLRGREEVLCG